MQYNIPDVHPAAMISAFHQNVRNRKMLEELAMNKVRDVAELYVLADWCARAEEGRKYPGEDAGVETDSTDDTATPARKGWHHNRKRWGKIVLAVEGSNGTGATKEPKASDPGKEVAGCATCRALAATDKPGGSDKQYCKIHRTKGHGLQNYRQIELLAEKQKAKYERGDKEKGQEGAEGSGKKHGGQGGRHGKGSQRERPAWGRDKKQEDDGHDEDDESGDHEFQKATEAMCVNGGASLHTSHRQLK